MKFASKSRMFAVFSVAIVALTLLFSVPVYPQAAGATIMGTVTDPSGAAIPNVQITVKNTATGVTRELTTNSSGFFSDPNVLPGTYDVTFSAPGFATVTESNLVLAVGDERMMDRALQVGQATQKVEVTAAAAQVQLANSTLSAEVNATTVRELPLNGRDWASLATLQPGVVPVRVSVSATSPNAPRSGRGFGNSLSDAGHRPNENNFRVNGISVLDYANGAPGSVLGGALGVDAIQEFSVLTSNYSAEYGHTTGGVINAITKSGTNSFHGSGYEFLRNNALDARNFFDNKIAPYRRNDFGGAIGGPIRKDKTFFFFDYEGIRSAKGITLHDKVLSPAARMGNLAGGTITVSPLVVPELALYPLPNAGLIGNGDTGFYNAASNQVFSENYETARVDHHISEKDTLAGSWFMDKAPFTQPDALNETLNASSTFREMASLEETHVFSPALVNTVRVGYNRAVGIANAPVKALVPAAADTSLAAIPGQHAANLTIPGLTTMAGAFGGSSASNYIFNTYQAYDDAFLTKGTHSLKFGFAFEREQFNGISYSRRNGTFTFPSYTGFLLDQPTNVQFPVPGSSLEAGLRQSIFAGYVQDDWRARSNLTLNLGLRYEPTTLPTERHNLFQSIPDSGFFTSASVPVHTQWAGNATLKDFEPRIGFAWDPSKNGKTAIRGGIGIFDNLPVTWLYGGGSTFTSIPFIFLATQGGLAPGTYPTLAVTSAGSNPKKAQYRYVQQHPPLSYGFNWNVNIQRQLTPSLTLMVGYVGSHSIHQPNTPDDSNMVLPTLTSAGYLWPFPVGSGTEFNQNVGTIRALTWAGSAKYEALQAQVTKKMSHGFQAQGAFTWGKCIDDGSGGAYGDQFGNSPSTLLWFDKSIRTGLCDFNVGKNFVFNYVWDAPTPKFAGALGSHLLGGWELAGIFTASTGTPFSTFIGGDPVGMKGDSSGFTTNWLAGCAPYSGNYRSNVDAIGYLNVNCFTPPTVPASFAGACQEASSGTKDQNGNTIFIPGTCMNLLGNYGRNELSGPGVANLDFSLIKNTYVRKISESFNVQFRAEFFNILNRANFQSPLDNGTFLNGDGSQVSGAGLIDATSTDSREIQLGLKIIF